MAYRAAMSAHWPQALQRDSVQSLDSASRRGLPLKCVKSDIAADRQAMRSFGMAETLAAARGAFTGTMSKTLTKTIISPARFKRARLTTHNLGRQRVVYPFSRARKVSSRAFTSKCAGAMPLSVASCDIMSEMCSSIASAAERCISGSITEISEAASAVAYITETSWHLGTLVMAGLYPGHDNGLNGPQVAQGQASNPWRPINRFAREIVAAQHPKRGG